MSSSFAKPFSHKAWSKKAQSGQSLLGSLLVGSLPGIAIGSYITARIPEPGFAPDPCLNPVGGRRPAGILSVEHAPL
jgi:hypothetical protein